jgi:hypothetical protein
VKLQVSLQCLQEHTTGPYPYQVKAAHIPSYHFNKILLILPSHRTFTFKWSLFRIWHELLLCTSLISSAFYMSCLYYPLHLLVLVISGEEYTFKAHHHAFNFSLLLFFLLSLKYSLQHPVLSHPKSIFVSNARDQVTHQQQTKFQLL